MKTKQRFSKAFSLFLGFLCIGIAQAEKMVQSGVCKYTNPDYNTAVGDRPIFMWQLKYDNGVNAKSPPPLRLQK